MPSPTRRSQAESTTNHPACRVPRLSGRSRLLPPRVRTGPDRRRSPAHLSRPHRPRRRLLHRCHRRGRRRCPKQQPSGCSCLCRSHRPQRSIRPHSAIATRFATRKSSHDRRCTPTPTRRSQTAPTTSLPTCPTPRLSGRTRPPLPGRRRNPRHHRSSLHPRQPPRPLWRWRRRSSRRGRHH